MNFMNFHLNTTNFTHWPTLCSAPLVFRYVDTLYSDQKLMWTLRNELCHVKDKRIVKDRSGVVYGLDCSDCSAINVGGTGRQFKDRMKEHHADIIEHLDLASLTRYDIWYKHKKYKYLWQINNTLNIRSQMFSLTSSEWSYFDHFWIRIHTDSKIIDKNSHTKKYKYHRYLYFLWLDRLS